MFKVPIVDCGVTLTDEQNARVQERIGNWKKAVQNLQIELSEMAPDANDLGGWRCEISEELDRAQKGVAVLQKFLDGEMDFKTYEHLNSRILEVSRIIRMLEGKRDKLQKKINDHLLLKMLVSDII